MGTIVKPYNTLTTIIVFEPVQKLSFLGREIAYRLRTITDKEKSEKTVIVVGFFLKEDAEEMIVEEVEARKEPKKKRQISLEQKGELVNMLVRVTGVSNITFSAEKPAAPY